MIRRVLLVLPIIVLALMPAVAAAQDEDDGVVFRINGTVRVDDDEIVESAIAINGNARVEGVVTDTVVVVNGDAVISGTVEGQVTVINGEMVLRSGATVDDVLLINSDLDRSSRAVITGSIDRGTWEIGPGVLLIPFLLWILTTVFIVLAGLFFAAVSGRQLNTSSYLLTAEIGPSLLASLILWIVLPALMTIAFFSFFGAPLGILLLVLMPLFWLIGYIVVGTRLGNALLRQRTDHPYLAAAVGLLILQVVGLIPLLGWLIVWLAGLIGGGAVALLAWRAWRARGATRPEPPRPAPDAR